MYLESCQLHEAIDPQTTEEWKTHSPLVQHYSVFLLVPGWDWQHVLACPTFCRLPTTPVFFPRWKLLMLPLEPTQTTRKRLAFFFKFSHCPRSPGLSLSLSLLSVSHTGTRQIPTPICLVINALPPPCDPSTSSWHLVQTMLTQPPPHRNCSTCSSWPHMFCFSPRNKLWTWNLYRCKMKLKKKKFLWT